MYTNNGKFTPRRYYPIECVNVMVGLVPPDVYGAVSVHRGDNSEVIHRYKTTPRNLIRALLMETGLMAKAQKEAGR